MKKLFTLLLIILLPGAFKASAQMFWVENFESGSTAGEVVTSYTGPNGAWTLTITGAEGTSPNQWYVSCAENGHTTGVCGTGCAPVTTTATLATLHVGSTTLGDLGASYDAGPIPNTTTDRRANSPSINCTGKYGITMSFYYIEDGDGTNDDATVWYSPDNGTTWNLLVNTPKTSLACAPQGSWTHYSIALPTSANNNPNVKIGFRWVNNNDGVGTDPSFAVDSITLSTSAAVAPVASFTTSSATACQDSCITFTSTSTGTIDSIRWTMPGMTITTPHASPLLLCNYTGTGTFTMHLYVYGPGGIDSTTHTVTINKVPQPTIIHTSGHLLTVSGTGYTQYIWSVGIPPTIITGATSSTYTYTVSGTYGVAVDSGGCWGYDTIVVSTTGITTINTVDNKYWVAQPSVNTINLYASGLLSEAVGVTVYDPTGRQIINDTWEKDKSSKQINCADCAPGLYIIRLSGKNTSAVLKWLK